VDSQKREKETESNRQRRRMEGMKKGRKEK
jgi:hypothetical protein